VAAWVAELHPQQVKLWRQLLSVWARVRSQVASDRLRTAADDATTSLLQGLDQRAAGGAAPAAPCGDKALLSRPPAVWMGRICSQSSLQQQQQQQQQQQPAPSWSSSMPRTQLVSSEAAAAAACQVAKGTQGRARTQMPPGHPDATYLGAPGFFPRCIRVPSRCLGGIWVATGRRRGFLSEEGRRGSMSLLRVNKPLSRRPESACGVSLCCRLCPVLYP